MSMGINNLTAGVTTQQSAYASRTEKNTNNTQAAEKQSPAGQWSSEAAIYEKGSVQKTATYSINKMSKEERAALVNQLKADTEQRQSQFLDIVRKTISGQASAFGKANNDSIWRTLASGNFTVDAATKAQAQKDIGEDGYWGVKQTSQRLFDFASALAGDDVEKMKKMQAAMEKGFKQATHTWGSELPSISQDTLSAANQLFDDYYKSKESVPA